MKFEKLYESILFDSFLLNEANVNDLIPIAREAQKERNLHTQALEKNQLDLATAQKEKLQELRKKLYELLNKRELHSTRKEDLTQEELDERIDRARINNLLNGLEHLHSRIIKKL
jgi:hypothetical protein